MVPENGVWERNGRTYPHILPRDKHTLNILPSFRDEFWPWFGRQRIQLQRDFHHLNSSQALCFNLFFPMLKGDRRGLAAFLSLMNIEGLPDDGASFEFQPDRTEGTCIDFSVPLKTGARINFEIKYTESEFGSAREDRQHLEKFEKVYMQRVASRLDESYRTPSQFLKHYQIARNIWHLNEEAKDIAVFLFPKANTSLRQEESVIRDLPAESLRAQIRIQYLEDVVSALTANLKLALEAHQQHVEEFCLKYL